MNCIDDHACPEGHRCVGGECVGGECVGGKCVGGDAVMSKFSKIENAPGYLAHVVENGEFHFYVVQGPPDWMDMWNAESPDRLLLEAWVGQQIGKDLVTHSPANPNRPSKTYNYGSTISSFDTSGKIIEVPTTDNSLGSITVKPWPLLDDTRI